MYKVESIHDFGNSRNVNCHSAKDNAMLTMILTRQVDLKRSQIIAQSWSPLKQLLAFSQRRQDTIKPCFTYDQLGRIKLNDAQRHH